MLLSVIVPCYNEKLTLPIILEKILASPIEKEIIIVDDYSTDGTKDILKNLKDPEIKVFYHSKNEGKGSALRTGFDPSDYPKLIEPILEDKADVVYGSRFQGGGPHRVVYFWHRIGNGLLTLLSNILTDLDLSDMETCFKVFKREVIQSIRIREDRFGFEPEITAKIAKMNLRIYEVGIAYYGRTYSEGKKITWKDGFRAIYCIIRYNLFK